MTDATAIAKLATEVSKTASKPLQESFADLFGIVVGDRIANWRLANTIKAWEKVNSIAAAAGVKPNLDRIPERFAFAWFEEASKQDDDTIQTMFARLLAAASNDGDDKPDERLIQLLARLTPIDAKIFAEFYAPPKDSPLHELVRLRSIGRWEAIGRSKLYHDLEQVFPNEAGRSIESLSINGMLEISYKIKTKSTFARAPKISNSNIEAEITAFLDRSLSNVELISHTRLGKELAALVLESPAPDNDRYFR